MTDDSDLDDLSLVTGLVRELEMELDALRRQVEGGDLVPADAFSERARDIIDRFEAASCSMNRPC